MNRRASDTKALQPLHVALTDALRQAGLDNVVTLVTLQRRWAAIAGSQLAAVSHPVRLRWGELLISVSDAIWLQQMTFYQARLRDNIRSVAGDVKVSSLRFVLAYAVRPAVKAAHLGRRADTAGAVDGRRRTPGAGRHGRHC